MADSVQIFPPGFRLPPSGRAEFYAAGSTDPIEVFADIDLNVTLGNTVYTDGLGAPVTAFGSSTRTLVYIDSDPYKIVIKDVDGVIVETHDNVRGAVVGGGGESEASTITQAQADARYVRNVNALSAETDIVDADLVPFWDISSAANRGITWANVKANLRAEGVTFSTGTKAVFYQASAPTGWTKDTTAALNDAAIRLTTGTGGSTGGSGGFTTVFASRTITQANLPSYTLPNTLSLSGSQTGGLVRNQSISTETNTAGGGGGTRVTGVSFTTTTLSLSGGVTSGGSGTAMDFAVKYANFIVCTKN